MSGDDPVMGGDDPAVGGDNPARLLRTPEEPRRYFLVPEDAEVPPGDLVVRTFDGRTERLSAEALAAYEVDPGRAAAHVDAGVERVLGPVRATIRGLFSRAEPPEPGSTEGSEEPQGGFGRDFARWLGVTPGEVMLDRDKRRQGRRTLLEKAASLVGPRVSDQDLDALEARMDRIGQAVVRDGARLREGTETLADRLDESRPAVEAAVQDAGERLAEFGQAALQELDRLGRRVAGAPEPPADPVPAAEEPAAPGEDETEVEDAEERPLPPPDRR